jgi:hypothetical protein
MSEHFHQYNKTNIICKDKDKSLNNLSSEHLDETKYTYFENDDMLQFQLEMDEPIVLKLSDKDNKQKQLDNENIDINQLIVRHINNKIIITNSV